MTAPRSGATRRIGGSLGYAFVATQVPHRAHIHRGHLVENLTPYDGQTTQAIDGLTGRLAQSGLAPGVAEDSAIKLLDHTVNRQATMMAYNDLFWMMGMMFVVSFPLLIMLGNRRQDPRT